MNREVYSRTNKTIDEWETPDYFFKLLDDIYHFTLDPCASDSNHKCEKYYTIKEDGLKQDWSKETVFVNPPFSNIKDWVKKCFDESQHFKFRKERNILATTVVMIIPSRTDTQYWHEHIMKAHEILFCKGRVNFLLNGEKPKNGSTFPLAVIVFRRIGIYNFDPKIGSFYHKEKDLKPNRTLENYIKKKDEEIF